MHKHNPFQEQKTDINKKKGPQKSLRGAIHKQKQNLCLQTGISLSLLIFFNKFVAHSM